MHLTKGSCFNCCTDAVLTDKTAKKARKIVESLFSVGNLNIKELKNCTHSLDLCPICYYQLELVSLTAKDSKEYADENQCSICSKSVDLVALASSEYFQNAAEDYKLCGDNFLCTACLFLVHFRHVMKKNLLIKFPKLKSEELPQSKDSPIASKSKLDLSAIKKMKPLSRNKRLGKAVLSVSDVKLLHQIPFVILDLVNVHKNINRPRIKIKLKKSKASPLFKSKKTTENWNATSSTCEYDTVNMSSEEHPKEHPEQEKPPFKRKFVVVEDEDSEQRITKKGVLKERRPSNDNSPSPKKKKKRVSFKESDEIIDDYAYNFSSGTVMNGEESIETRHFSYKLVVNLVNMKIQNQNKVATESRALSPDSTETTLENGKITEEFQSGTSLSSCTDAVSMPVNADSDSDDGIVQKSKMEPLKLSDEDSVSSDSTDKSAEPGQFSSEVVEKVDIEKCISILDEEQSTDSKTGEIDESKKTQEFKKRIKRRKSITCERLDIEEEEYKDQPDPDSENLNSIVENEDEPNLDVPVAIEHVTDKGEAEVPEVAEEENDDNNESKENSHEIEEISDDLVHNEELSGKVETGKIITKSNDDKNKTEVKQETDEPCATNNSTQDEEAVSVGRDRDGTTSPSMEVREDDEEVEATDEESNSIRNTSTIDEKTESPIENDEVAGILNEKDENSEKESGELATEEESNGIRNTSTIDEKAESSIKNDDAGNLNEKDENSEKESGELDLIRKYMSSGDTESKTDKKNESVNELKSIEREDLLSIIGIDSSEMEEVTKNDEDRKSTEQFVETAHDKKGESDSKNDKSCNVNNQEESGEEQTGDAGDGEKLNLGEMDDCSDG